MASFSVALDGRFEPIGNRSFGSPEAQDVPAGSAGTPSSSVNVGDTSATAVANTPATNSSSLTFKDAFGADARLVRTNDPNNMFAVETVTANTDPGQVDDTGWHRPTDNPWGEWSATTSARWNYDVKTQTFTSPDGKKKVSAASLGIGGASDGRAVPYLLAPIATESGQNGDSWSNYALTHNSYGDGKQGSSSFRLAGAQALMQASGDIISYDNKPSQGSKWAGLVVAGGLALTGFGTALAGALGGGFTGSMAAGAVIGGGSAAVTGGDPLKGALIGAAGGAIGYGASGLEGGANYKLPDGFVGPPAPTGLLSPSNIANAAGKAGLAAVSGGDPLAAGVSSLLGSATTNATGEQFFGSLASSGIKMALSDTPTMNSAVRSSAQSTSSAPAGSAVTTSQTSGNVNSSATFRSALPSEFKYVNLSRG